MKGVRSPFVSSYRQPSPFVLLRASQLYNIGRFENLRTLKYSEILSSTDTLYCMRVRTFDTAVETSTTVRDYSASYSAYLKNVILTLL